MVVKKTGKGSVKKNYFTMLVSGLAIILLFSSSLYFLYRRSETIVNDVVIEHIEELADIFKKIDETAGIVGFEHEKNYIDFLTVISFVGSEVGSMNLQNPSGWDGPYLKDNPTIQEKYYVIIAGKQGYYIAPDNGVVLSNGKVIGKDIILNKDTDFEAIAKDPELVLHKDKALVRKIK